MSKLNVNSHFATTPSMIGSIGRSRFDRSFRHLTTFNAGNLIPIFTELMVLPGDTVSLDLRSFVRQSTPIHPVMDDAYVDTYFFFVPYRLVWDEFKQFMGENDSSSWAPQSMPVMPTLDLNPGNSSNYDGLRRGSTLDYMGIPFNDNRDFDDESFLVPGDRYLPKISALPPRAVALIWNNWFRSEALQDPAFVPTDSVSRRVADVIGNDSGYGPSFVSHTKFGYLGVGLFPVDKYFDYFTSALPAPQRGEAVRIPTGTSLAPVFTSSDNHNLSSVPLHLSDYNGPISFSSHLYVSPDSNMVADKADSSVTITKRDNIFPVNLWSSLGDGLGTINDLRIAFQTQKMLEADARGGGRYTSLVLTHFNVQSPDARQQIPEFIGGSRTHIGMQQVVQTSSTDDTSPQGNLAAYSLTSAKESMFTYSATEHGMILGFACVRTKHSYSYGIEREWFIKNRYDIYWPELANIGELPIWQREIFAYEGDDQYSDPNGAIFGYQEAWASYRYKPNMITSSFRPQYRNTLDVWHYGDRYASAPVLSESWIVETENNIDRTLAVRSTVEDQFIADFFFDYIHVRPMPTYSIPGLADHH